MSYRLVRQLQQKAIAVKHLCRVLQVSRAGYYQHWQRSAPAVDIVTTVHLKAAFSASALQAKGFFVGRYRVRRRQ
jgi:hypothetical protein